MDWIAITCWVVFGVSGLLALWALFWDRPRGRLRCRKCAYDMSGGGLVCPECGREHKTQRSLRKTRRKWKTAVVAILTALVATHAQHQKDLIHYEGMSGLLPTFTLAVLADPSVIETGIGRHWTGIESKLHTRMMMGRSSSIAEWIWMRKIAKYMQSTSVNAEHLVDVYDISDIVNEYEIFSTKSSYKQAIKDGRATVIGEIRRLHSETIAATILARLSISDYKIGSGNENECHVDSGSVVLRAKRRVHEHFANSLDEIRTHSWTVGRSSLPSVSTTACYVLYRIDTDEKSLLTLYNTSDVMYRHINQILPGAFDPAYEPSRVAIVANGFVVWADPEDHIEIIEYLQSLSSMQ